MKNDLNQDKNELRVSTLELFFDLVFVFTITQLTVFVEHHLSLIGILKATAIFTLLYWMYSGYSWLTNQVPPNALSRRVLLLGGMAAFLTCALAIPNAFDKSALAFAVSYSLVVLVHSCLYALEHRATVWRFVPFNLIGAICLIAAAFTNESIQVALWGVAIGLLFLVTALLAGNISDQKSSGYNLQPGHFVERHGLLLIIAFGESIIAIGISLGRVEFTPIVSFSAVLGLVLISSLWWLFFTSDQVWSERRLHAVPVKDKVRLALLGYYFTFIPIMLGIVCLSAGLGHAVSHITHTLPSEFALLLGSGTALYLLGISAFRGVFDLHPVFIRVVGAICAIATYWAGVGCSALIQVVLLIIIVMLLIFVESWFPENA